MQHHDAHGAVPDTEAVKSPPRLFIKIQEQNLFGILLNDFTDKNVGC